MINETLLEAARYMDEHGKAYGIEEDLAGAVCMAGAMRKVVDAKPWTQDQRFEVLRSMYNRLYAHAYRQEFVVFTSVPFMNDHYLDTKEETVKFMMEAAEWEPNNG